MPNPTKYFILNSNGFFINWHSDIPGLETEGQALEASGSFNDDSVYVGKNTFVDASRLTQSSGQDSIYLTGNFADYTESNSGPIYTLTKSVNNAIVESLIFTSSNRDILYFADGFINIGRNTLRITQKLSAQTFHTSKITPDSLDSIPEIAEGGATLAFITDASGANIPSAIKGSKLTVYGSFGSDTVYVAKGTQVNAVSLTQTPGNDIIYLTGNFADYNESHSGPVYSLVAKDKFDGLTESVTFSASNGDKLYFADGYIEIGRNKLNNGSVALKDAVFKTNKSTPGLSIGLVISDDQDNTVKIGDVITYTFTFNEAVKDFTIDDININNASVKTGASLVPYTSGENKDKIYTLEITPNANAQGDIVVSVDKDAANALTGDLKSGAANHSNSFDTILPTLIIDDNKANTLTLKTGDEITYTFTFSEVVTGFNKDAITITNGAIKQGTSLVEATGANAGKVYTLTVVPGSNQDIGSKLTVSVPVNAAIVDNAGNAYSTAATANEQAIDTKAPIATLSGNMSGDGNLIMTFAEAVAINTAGSITIYEKDNSSNAIAIDMQTQVSLDSAKKIITINPGSDLIANKNYYVKIDNGTFTDIAGNNYQGISNDSDWNFLVSSFTTTAQWVNASGEDVSYKGVNAAELSTLAIQGTLTNGSSVTGVTIASIIFKASSGASNNVSVSADNLPTFASTNGAQWTLANSKIPALVNGETYTIEVALSSTGGGTAIGGNTAPVFIDSQAPTIQSWLVGSPENGQSGFKVNDVITLTMTTDEALVLNNAANSKVTISGKEFTLDASQGAAKTGASASELKQLVFTYIVKSNDNVSKANFEISNASAISLLGVEDAIGNAVATTGTYPVELNRKIDGIVPIINSITSNWGNILNAAEDNSDGMVTITTTGVENNQTIFLVINNKTYTDTVSDNSATISVAAADLQELTNGQTYEYKATVNDSAGNQALEKKENFEVDTVVPMIVSSKLDSGSNQLILTLSKTVTGTANIGSFTVTLQETSGSAETTINVTSVNVDGKIITLTLANSVTQTAYKLKSYYMGSNKQLVDVAGNTIADDTSRMATIVDITKPSIISFSSSTDNGSYKAGDSINITATASEALKVGSKITVILSTDKAVELVAATDGITLTGSYTVAPNQNSTDLNVNSFTLGTGSATPKDIAGNLMIDTTLPTGNNNIAVTKEIVVDTSAPTLTIDTSTSSSTIKTGGEITFTFTFSELVSGFTKSDIVITNGAIKTGADLVLTTTGANANKAYTLVVIPSPNTEGQTGVSVDIGQFSDIAGNTNAVATSDTQTVDTLAPTISDVTISGHNDAGALKSGILVKGDKVIVTLTSSEAVTVAGVPTYKFMLGSVEKTAQYDATLSSDSTKIKFSYTIVANDIDSTGGITAAANKLTLSGGATIKDTVGNPFLVVASPAANANTIIVEAAPPAPISTDAWSINAPASGGTFAVGEDMKITLAMSEALTFGSAASGEIIASGKRFTLNKTDSTTAGNDKLVFTHTVVSGDIIADIKINSVTLNNVTDNNGNEPSFSNTSFPVAIEIAANYFKRIYSGFSLIKAEVDTTLDDEWDFTTSGDYREWDSSAYSDKGIVGDGYITATYSNNNNVMIFGFSTNNNGLMDSDTDYAFGSHIGTTYMFAKGFVRGSGFQTNGFVTLKIERIGTEINFYNNNTLMHNVKNVSTEDLHLDMAFNSGSSSIKHIRMYQGLTILANSGVAPSLDDASVNGNTLTLGFDAILKTGIAVEGSFAVEVNGVARTVSNTTVNNKNVTFSINGAAIADTDIVTAEYVNPKLQYADNSEVVLSQHVIVGTSGNNTLTGLNTLIGDVFVGNGGDDTLTGGSGTDIFDYNSVNDGNDIIKNFTRTGNSKDKIDLSDLITTTVISGGAGSDDASLFYREVSFTTTDNDVVIAIKAGRDRADDSTGADPLGYNGNNPDITITIENLRNSYHSAKGRFHTIEEVGLTADNFILI